MIRPNQTEADLARAIRAEVTTTSIPRATGSYSWLIDGPKRPEPPGLSKKRWSRRTTAFVLGGIGLWLAAAVVVAGLLYVRHSPISMPSRSDATLKRAAVAALGMQHEPWGTLHVMYRECACSAKTIEHLLARRARPSVTEVVVMVDDAVAPGTVDDRLRAAGYRVEVISPATLREKFGIEAAPVFVVVKPDGTIGYVGGYNRHKQEPRYADVKILLELMNKQSVSALPVFGCPTSARLAAAADPLGLAPRKRAQRP